MKCNICGSEFKDNAIVVKQYIQCSNCKVFTRRNPFTEAELASINSNMMLTACDSKAGELRRLDTASRQLSMLEKYTPIGVVYDIGAAAGFFMKAAQDKGWEVHGNELSNSAINWSKSHYDINIEYGYFENLDISRNYFDVVVMWNTLEHTLNPYKTMELCYNILKKDGIVLIEVPLKNAVELKDNIELPHVTEFDMYGLDLLLRNTGFKELYRIKNDVNNVRHIDIIYRKIK